MRCDRHQSLGGESRVHASKGKTDTTRGIVKVVNVYCGYLNSRGRLAQPKIEKRLRRPTR